MQAAADRQVRLADIPRAVAARAMIVISIITEDDGVRGLYCGADGFLSGDVGGKLFIEMSTLRPMTGRELAPLVEAAGRATDRVAGARHHPARCAPVKLLALVGGKAEDLDRARPVLAKLTRRIEHMGPNGAGYAMKLAANLGLAACIQATGESLALGAARGSEPAADARRPERERDRQQLGGAQAGLLMGEPEDITLDIRTLRKDLMSVVATGAAVGAGLPLSASVLASLVGRGGGRLGRQGHRRARALRPRRDGTDVQVTAATLRHEARRRRPPTATAAICGVSSVPAA